MFYDIMLKKRSDSMKYHMLRDELKKYYIYQSYGNAEKFKDACTEALDLKYSEDMSPYKMKTMQYKTIVDMIEPVIFEQSPFYYETGTLPGFSDGARDYHGYKHAGGWTYWKNSHLFSEQDEELWDLRCKQSSELLYLICGEYNDTSQHFQINHRPIFKMGLRGIYEKAKNALKDTTDEEEKEFLNSVCDALLCVKIISEKFYRKAKKLLREYPDNENYRLIFKSASKCPWEKPESFYEALNTYAFMRKVIGSLEGIGPNSFGRIDMDLYPFYRKDIEEKRISEAEARDLIAKFLVTWDSHYDHDMKMVGYADHELENTYVVGGCDGDGNPVYNELTKLFLEISNEEKIVFPKIKCRFSKNSPKEYFEIINKPLTKGTSTILYQNDDAVIPALMRNGRTQNEARDYLVAGCWGLFTNCNDCKDDASYVNLLKAFELQIHQTKEKMEKIRINFKPIDYAKNFEEVYKITCDNMNLLFKERTEIATKGGQIWSKVDPLPLFSSLMNDCIDNKKDFTACGTKYKDDSYMCVGFPNIVDSLLVIKKLCFDEKKYTLKELLSAVRNNWKDNEGMRIDAIACPGWGDGSDESCSLARRFNTSLYDMLSKLTGIHGGKIHLGHMTYTEIRFWGEKTLATPDGRYDGDYFSQGLTPSRLKKIPNVTDVIRSMGALDKTELSGNNVINIILPGTTPVDVCESFLRTVAETAVESLQLNCVSKETLLDAQKNPDKYPDLIVRVCGFSAKFTSLSQEWQDEVISRNFYE